MLQSIREHTQGWIAGIIVSLIILSFALWGIHSYFEGGAAKTVIAEVNGAEITKNDLTVAYERLRRQLQLQYNSNAQLPQQAETVLKQKALQSLIDVQVMKQAALNQKYRISQDQIDYTLTSMPEFQVDGEFSLDRFQQVLNSALFNTNDFLDLVRTNLLIDQPRYGILFSSFALPYEINGAVSLVNQERDIIYAMLPFKTLAAQPITISDEKIQAYYKSHEDAFKTPEQVAIEYVVLSLKDLMAKIQAGEDELRKFYNDNKSSFTQPAEFKFASLIIPIPENADMTALQTKVKEISEKANKGESFEVLAKTYSLKSDSKWQDWTPINRLAPELQKVAMGLKKDQVSNPVKVNSDVVILKAIDVKAPQTQTYEQAKENVKQSYARQHAEEKFAELREKLSSSSYEHPDSLEFVSKALNLPIQNSEVFSKAKGGEDISKDAKVRETAFSNDVLNLRNNSELLQVGDDAVVLRVKTHNPASLQALDAVKAQIIDKLKNAEIEQKTAALANELKGKLQADAPADQIAKQYNITWVSPGFVSRHGNKVNSAITETAFAMPKPKGAAVTYAVAKLPEGYAVIGLKAAKNNNTALTGEKRVIFAEQIQNEQAQLEYDLYKQSQIDQAKVVMEQ